MLVEAGRARAPPQALVEKSPVALAELPESAGPRGTPEWCRVASAVRPEARAKATAGPVASAGRPEARRTLEQGPAARVVQRTGQLVVGPATEAARREGPLGVTGATASLGGASRGASTQPAKVRMKRLASREGAMRSAQNSGLSAGLSSTPDAGLPASKGARSVPFRQRQRAAGAPSTTRASAIGLSAARFPTDGCGRSIASCLGALSDPILVSDGASHARRGPTARRGHRLLARLGGCRTGVRKRSCFGG